MPTTAETYTDPSECGWDQRNTQLSFTPSSTVEVSPPMLFCPPLYYSEKVSIVAWAGDHLWGASMKSSFTNNFDVRVFEVPGVRFSRRNVCSEIGENR